MSRPGPITPWAAARVLGLLAVVLGLLGMHGLASTHSLAAAPVHAPAPVLFGDTRPSAHAAVVGHHAAGRGTEVGTGTVITTGTGTGTSAGTVAGGGTGAGTDAVLTTGLASTGWPGPACDDRCPDAMTAVCAAVLAAVAVAAALARAAARRPLLPSRPAGRPRAPVLRRRLPPAPDPVAELCVSRT